MLLTYLFICIYGQIKQNAGNLLNAAFHKLGDILFYGSFLVYIWQDNRMEKMLIHFFPLYFLFDLDIYYIILLNYKTI